MLHSCDLDINNTFTKFLKLSENKFTEHVSYLNIFANLIINFTNNLLLNIYDYYYYF